ncbi:TPM domain-containing protein [Homoserinimonas sp. OAct 916]|uniref:TPM domain-containing protein n=1 Tax=Homoserinimonas sp. OAct 916 TaxID=2211450 RepID=UPI000DBE1326|nr:TPM domain-containing protein [Homoserinimonas sp. OAct 916]
MHVRRRFGALVLTAALAIGMALAGQAVALAESPVSFGSSPIVDEAGVLGNDTAAAEKAIADLRQSTGMNLFVAYVNTFTNPTNSADWADTTAELNNMGTDDYLLAVAVATDSRAFYLSAAADSPLTDQQLTAVQRAAKDQLSNENWSRAVLATAAALQSAGQADGQVGGPVDSGSTSPGNSTSGGGGGGGVILLVVILLIVAAGVVLAVILRRRKRPSASGDSGDLPSLEQLARLSGSALVQTDDAVKSSEQELGFAIAQFGADATADFQTALTGAQAKLREAFGLQQKLDDAIPDTDEEQREWRSRIIELCDHANNELDEQTESFDALRALEKDAPAAIAKLQSDAAATSARIGQAEKTLSDLAATYAGTALSTVHDNVSQAKERLAFATSAVADAQEKLDSGDTGQAAVGIHAAVGAVGQSALLLDAVDRVKADLDSSREQITASVTDLTADVQAAQAAVAAGATGLEPVINTVQQAIARAQAGLGGGVFDPVAITTELEAANQQIDSAMAGIRSAQEQQQRAQAALAHTLITARSKVSAAEDFITARRGAVGAEARTRLAEAAQLTVQAEGLQTTDPVQALSLAQRADQLAAQSIQLAQRDVGGFSAPSGDVFGGMFGGSSPSSGGGMGGLITGAILGGLLGGGGSFGGTSSRNRSTWSGGRGGSSRSGGGFGGSRSSGSSGRRSGSSGGRRGGGGRF